MDTKLQRKSKDKKYKKNTRDTKLQRKNKDRKIKKTQNFPRFI